MWNRKRLYKKSDTTARHIILMVIILLIVAVVVGALIYGTKDRMYSYIDVLFG